MLLKDNNLVMNLPRAEIADELARLTKESNDTGTTPQNLKSFNNSLNCTFLENVVNKRQSCPQDFVHRNVFEIIKQEYPLVVSQIEEQPQSVESLETPGLLTGLVKKFTSCDESIECSSAHLKI